MKQNHPILLPIFDTLEQVKQQSAPQQELPPFAVSDFSQAHAFLISYNGNAATFNSYRREVERLLHWAWRVACQSVRDLKRADIEAYIAFCQNPPLDWIGTKKEPRFIEEGACRIPNTAWRPFVVTLSKVEHQRGQTPDPKKYALSQKALSEIFTITSTFYNFLIQNAYTEINPILHVRQKSRYFRKVQGSRKIRRLSELQWAYVIETAEKMATHSPERHERTLFMISALFGMYLRISELAASARWTPKMSDFYCDHDGLWWFTTVGKGNKERQISVSDSMLSALRRYRLFLGKPPLPSTSDHLSLFPKHLGRGPITSTSYLREIVQNCFDEATHRLKQDGFDEDAEKLQEATVHWLRHTGISEDVKHRPREHVRDDAGHSSSAITDKYIDIELRARHASAKNKTIKADA